MTTWTDPSVVAGETYEYRLRTRLESGDPWFEMSSLNLTISAAAPEIPFGWLESVTSSERWWHESVVTPEAAEVVFGFGGPVDEISIEYRYGSKEPTLHTFSTVPSDFRAVFEVANPSQSEIEGTGGLAFRLRMRHTSQFYYFPPDGGWVFTSLNNRLLNPLFGEYLPNPASTTWRNQVAQGAIALVSGSDSPHGAFEFDGIFGDNAFMSISTANAPMVPVDYQGDAAYQLGMSQLIQFLRAELDIDTTNLHDLLFVNSVYSDYHLPSSPNYAPGLDGIMIESSAWCGDNWLRLAGLVQRSVREVTTEGFSVLYASAATLWDWQDEYFDQLRIYELATYFLLRDNPAAGDQGRLAFGTPYRRGSGLSGLMLFPEVTLYLGEPLNDPVFDADLPTPPPARLDRDNPPCPENFDLHTRVYERGLVVLDRGQFSDRTVDFQAIYAAANQPCPAVLHRLEIPQWGDIASDGYVRTYPVSTDPAHPFILPSSFAAIFLTEPTATPRAPVAMALVAGEVESKLAIRPIAGSPLSTCRIMGETLTGGQWVTLEDDGSGGDVVSDDNLYTKNVNSTGVTPGQTLQLQWYAENEWGLVGMGSIDVPVIEPLATAYGDYSDQETSDLADPSFQGAITSSLAFDGDGDGRLDLLLSREQTAPALFWNSQNDPDSHTPEFELLDPQFWLPGISLSSANLGMAAADVDNDGDQEPVLAHYYDTRLLRNDGTQPGEFNFGDDTARFGNSNAHQQATCAAWSDIDMDGRIDLFLGRAGSFTPPDEPADPTTQAVSQYVFVNRGDHFEPLPLGGEGGSATACYAATWGDVDADGDQDLVMGASPGHLRVFSNDGFDPILDTSLLVDRSAAMVVNGSGHDPTKIVALTWHDLDGQAGPDLVAGSIEDDGLYVYRNQGSVLEAVEPAAIGLNPLVGPVKALTRLDYDLNGWQDLLVARAGGKPPLLIAEGLISNRSVEISDLLDLGEDAAPVVIAADFDNADADPDLYLGRHVPQVVGDRHFYFRNERPDGSDHLTSDPKWVKITLEGTTSNALAIGARVIVDLGTGPIEQTVDGGSGRGCQRPSTLDFWVGDYPGPNVPVTVIWPNGHQQSASASLGQRTTIIEDGARIPFDQITSTYSSGATGTSFVFEWVIEGTDQTCQECQDPARDRVYFTKEYGDQSPCYCHEGAVLHDSATDVTVAINWEPSAGVWRHRLTWTDGCCTVQPYPGCQYDFRVESDLGTRGLLRSPTKRFHSILACGKKLPPPPDPNNP